MYQTHDSCEDSEIMVVISGRLEEDSISFPVFYYFIKDGKRLKGVINDIHNLYNKAVGADDLLYASTVTDGIGNFPYGLVINPKYKMAKHQEPKDIINTINKYFGLKLKSLEEENLYSQS